jgi:hypothetical protein
MSRWLCILVATTMLTANIDFSQSTDNGDLSPKLTEHDLNEDGKVDRRNSVYQLDRDLVFTIHERLDYETDELIARLHSLKLGKKELWWEIFVVPTKTRSISCPAESPLSVSVEMEGAEVTLVAVFDKTHLVAALERNDDGKLIPASQDELRRYRKLGKAVAEFAQGILDEAESQETDEGQE